MRFYVLFLLPWAFVLTHVIVAVGWSDQAWYLTFLRFEILTVKSLSLLGFAIAASKFRRGDHLRKAWLIAVTYMSMFIISDVIALLNTAGTVGQAFTLNARAVVLFAGNLFLVLGFWMLARTWQTAGLEFSASVRGRRIVIVGAILLSLGMAGPAAARGWLQLVAGTPNATTLINVIGGVGDILALTLIAPMLLTARTLRGGQLQWPWIFLTGILFGWLGFDAMYSWGPVVGLTPLTTQWLADAFRIFACLYGLSAGAAQVLVMEEIGTKT